MQPTEDSFRALARSSPWRWRTLSFRHRSSLGAGGDELEAWVRRPGHLRVVTADREEFIERGLPYTTATLGAGAADTDSTAPERPLPHQVTPAYRPDGLVAERPSEWEVDYDDPMWQTYSWVAMLDPVELSHHVRVDHVRPGSVAGRPVWWARLVAEMGYEPRCGGNCCELLYSEAGLMADFHDISEVPEDWRDRTYPDAYQVALDVATGVVVRLHPEGGAADAPWLENDILASG